MNIRANNVSDIIKIYNDRYFRILKSNKQMSNDVYTWFRVTLQLTFSQSVSQSVRLGLEPFCEYWSDFSCS